MPQLLTNPDQWRMRAQEARRRARQLDDPKTKAIQLRMAKKYDDLAVRATEWLNKTEGVPQFLKSGLPTAP